MMTGEPTLSDVMNRLTEIHTDVGIALDRTVRHEGDIKKLYEVTSVHAGKIAKAEGAWKIVGFVSGLLGATIGYLVDMYRGTHGGV